MSGIPGSPGEEKVRSTLAQPGRRPPPLYAIVLRRIGESDLDAGCKNVMRVLLEWVNFKSGVLWPSVSLIAQRAGLTDRGVHRILRRLQAAGVLTVAREGGGVDRGGRGRSTRYQCHFDALHVKSRDQSLTVSQGLIAPEPRPARPRTPTQGPANPDLRSGKPSIHEPASERAIVPFQQTVIDRGDEMDGRRSPRHENAAGWDELRRAGVRGQNLRRLAACPLLTPAVIREELDSIRQDGNVRSVPGVLVRRLAERTGLRLRTQGRLDADAMASVARVEALRRTRAQIAGSSPESMVA